MNNSSLLLCLFGILGCFFIEIVAHEAIVGGKLALNNSFEYHVSILIHGEASRCGGGILKEQFVLTAAHCVVKTIGHLCVLLSHNISILAGTVDLTVPGIVNKVDRVYVPSTYKSENSINGDIAVLLLKNPLDMDKYNLKWLQIPLNHRASYANKWTEITGLGWDRIYENNDLIGESSDHRLRFACSVVLNNIECRHNHPNETISEKHLCARVTEKLSSHSVHRRGVCIGDGGGPLVYKSTMVIGILSKSTIGCSESNSSGIYTRVSHYINFIQNALKKKSTWAMRELIV